MLPSCLNFTLLQVSVEVGSKSFSLSVRSSPILAEVKKAVVQADHTDWVVPCDQEEMLRRWPMCLRSCKVMTRLGLAGGEIEDMMMLPAPFRAAATRSSLMEKLAKPFIRCSATTADR